MENDGFSTNKNKFRLLVDLQREWKKSREDPNYVKVELFGEGLEEVLKGHTFFLKLEKSFDGDEVRRFLFDLIDKMTL